MAGMRVKLIYMEDPQAPALGTEGTVQFIDDIGTIHVAWDTGCSLGLVPGVDEWKSSTNLSEMTCYIMHLE